MKRFKIEDLFEVADAMYSGIVDNGLDDVVFVGHYGDVIWILKHLISFDETIPCHIDIEDIGLGGYDKEYYITLDADMQVWCEQAYDYENDCYLYSETERLYIADDCNSKLLGFIETREDEIYEVTYGLDNNEPEKDCPEKDSHGVLTRVATDKNGRLKGFEKIWDTFDEDGLNYHSTYSFFSSNEDMLKNMLNNFGIKY